MSYLNSIDNERSEMKGNWHGYLHQKWNEYNFFGEINATRHNKYVQSVNSIPSPSDSKLLKRIWNRYVQMKNKTEWTIQRSIKNTKNKERKCRKFDAQSGVNAWWSPILSIQINNQSNMHQAGFEFSYFATLIALL